MQPHQRTQSALPSESTAQLAEHACAPRRCSSRFDTSDKIVDERPRTSDRSANRAPSACIRTTPKSSRRTGAGLKPTSPSDHSSITYSYKRIRQQFPHYYPPHPPHKQLRIVVSNRDSLTSKMNQRNRSSQQFPQQLHAAFQRIQRRRQRHVQIHTVLSSSVQTVSYHSTDCKTSPDRARDDVGFRAGPRDGRLRSDPLRRRSLRGRRTNKPVARRR